MNFSLPHIWLIILALGVGTYLIRFSFWGLVGSRDLPPWLLRHLRYTPVAVMPGLVAPLVLWPEATGGNPDPARLTAAIIALGLGWWTKNVLLAILGGAISLFTMIVLVG